jgi:hypothetical protein
MSVVSQQPGGHHVPTLPLVHWMIRRDAITMHKNKMQTNRKCKGTVNKVHGAQKGATKKKSRVQKQDN